jgi:hypothetical protein
MIFQKIPLQFWKTGLQMKAHNQSPPPRSATANNIAINSQTAYWAMVELAQPCSACYGSLHLLAWDFLTTITGAIH